MTRSIHILSILSLLVLFPGRSLPQDAPPSQESVPEAIAPTPIPAPPSEETPPPVVEPAEAMPTEPPPVEPTTPAVVEPSEAKPVEPPPAEVATPTPPITSPVENPVPPMAVETAPAPPPISGQTSATDASYVPIDFKELSFALRPGMLDVKDGPSNLDGRGIAIGAHTTYFFGRWVGLNVPYTYSRYDSDTDAHSVGGGALVRFFDHGLFRGSVDANALYVRVLGGNHFGYSFGADFTIGKRNHVFRPFIGPFVRYDKVAVSGTDISTVTYGITVTLTNYTDHLD